jgi:hypothetical protein
MGLRELIDRVLRPAGKAVDEAEYGVVEAVHHAEERLDAATGGRYYEVADEVDRESDELLDRLHLNEPPVRPEAAADAAAEQPADPRGAD